MSAVSKDLENKGESLVVRLRVQEESRTIYWNKFDPFLNLRMGWRASGMRHLFHILPGQKILEVGAGNGKFTHALNKVTGGKCEITAVVFSKKYYDTIKNYNCSQNINVKYLESFPGTLDKERFDCIVTNHMLERQSQNIFFYALKSLLKPGGKLLLFETNPWNPYLRLRKMIRKLFPIFKRRPSEAMSLSRLQVFSVLSEIGYTQINVLPYDFLYSPIPRFLLWTAQHMSIIVENTPYLRNFAGSLYIWASNPAPEGYREPSVDLAEHQMFFGRVSFVVPCHNEEMNIIPLIEGLKNFYQKYILEIIIVDDNSSDKTAEIAEDYAKGDRRISLVRRSFPNGVGRALRDGINKAEGEYIVIMDSDFQHIIPEMKDLFNAVAQGADVAVGSRFSRKSVLVNYAFTKIIANRVFHLIANLLLSRRFRDISNNLKIFRRKAVKGLVIESDGFAANVETGLKPILLGYKVIEVPISWMDRSANMGLSTFRIVATGPAYFKILFRLVWRRITRQPYQR